MSSSVVSFRDNKMDGLKEEMQELSVSKLCIYQGKPSTNSPVASKFVISCICLALTAEIFIILVSLSLFILQLLLYSEGQEFHIFFI